MVKKLIMFVINADTESTVEGYMSAFIASKMKHRFQVPFPPGGKNPTKKYLKQRDECIKIIEGIPDHFETTRQSEVRQFFDMLHNTLEKLNLLFKSVRSSAKKTEFEPCCIVEFANSGWDIDVLRGIIFPNSPYEVSIIGSDSDMVQLVFGRILIRDFLRITGFRSVRAAGKICKDVHKLDGTETYDLKLADVPERFDNYSETVKQYIRNDVAVMDESLNIFLNQPANRCIENLSDVPMTSTGFSRYRQQHSEEIIMINGNKVNSSYQITSYRWKYTKPYLLFLIDSFKGGYCGPNPHTQYKIMKNGVCFDAVSMYPDKMCGFRFLQCTKDSRMLKTDRTLEELSEVYPEVTEDEQIILRNLSDTLNFFNRINDRGFQPDRPDGENGIFGWIASVTLQIRGVRYDPRSDCCMMPFLSSYKSETPVKPSDHVITANGKVISAERFTIKLSCIDLIITLMSYDCDIISISHMLTMGWKGQLPVQKKSVLYGYKMKMEVSEAINKPLNEQKDYWENVCGFNFASIVDMEEAERKDFSKTYKQMIKAIPNGEFGKQVEKPIKALSWITLDKNGIPEVHTETPVQMMHRVHHYMRSTGGFYDQYGDEIPLDESCIYPPPDAEYPIPDKPAIPESVKCNDYCGGSSCTMWARWQLFSMMYILFKHGFEVWYCDTDSLFTEDNERVRELFTEFNVWKNSLWKWYVFSENEIYNSEQLDGLGQFEVDKEMNLFCSLGAKNYAYTDRKKDEIHLTIAGLNTKRYEKILNGMNEENELILYKYYHPNIYIEPSVCGKLVKTRDTCGFDENGLYCGCTLLHYGFSMIASDSKFHLNNMARAEDIQGLSSGTYTGRWNNKLYLSDNGFFETPQEGNETVYEAFLTVEEQTHFLNGKEVGTDG